MSSQAEEDGCRACRWRESALRFDSRLGSVLLLSLIGSYPFPIEFGFIIEMLLENF